MTRLIVVVFALLLTAGAVGLIGGASGRVPTPTPGVRAEAMIVLTAADTDRGVQGLERKKTAKAPSAEDDADKPAASAKVLPQRHHLADAVELSVLMASGFAIGLAAFALGGVAGRVATASFSGLAVGAAAYAFLVGSPVSQPNMTIAAALLIFSASALAPNLIGRAGFAAAKRVGRRLFTGRRGIDEAAEASAGPSSNQTD